MGSQLCDRWLHGCCIGQSAPVVLLAVPKSRRRRSVASALTNRAWVSDIRGVPTVQLLLEYLQLWEVPQNVQLEDRAPESRHGLLVLDGGSGIVLRGHVHRIWLNLWEPRRFGRPAHPDKVKFFFWLVLHRRCWIAARRKPHGLLEMRTLARCAIKLRRGFTISLRKKFQSQR